MSLKFVKLATVDRKDIRRERAMSEADLISEIRPHRLGPLATYVAKDFK